MSWNVRGRSEAERGITGLETAIILIAFVVVATVFAFTVLSTGVFSAERSKETIYAGLQEARSSREPRGSVIAYSGGAGAGPGAAAARRVLCVAEGLFALGQPASAVRDGAVRDVQRGGGLFDVEPRKIPALDHTYPPRALGL